MCRVKGAGFDHLGREALAREAREVTQWTILADGERAAGSASAGGGPREARCGRPPRPRGRSG